MSSEFLNVLASGVFAPKPKAQQWVSESGVKFHLEKPVSVAAAMGDFTALCGAAGQFFYDKYEGQTFLRCANCLEVANQGKALQQGIESLRIGDDSGGASSVCAPVESSQPECLPYQALNTGAGVQSTATDCTPEIFKSFSCVRRGIDGFIAAVDICIDRANNEGCDESWSDSQTAAEMYSQMERGCR